MQSSFSDHLFGHLFALLNDLQILNVHVPCPYQQCKLLKDKIYGIYLLVLDIWLVYNKCPVFLLDFQL